MGYVQTTAPTDEPITVAQAKQHTRNVYHEEDNLVAHYISVARQMIEDEANIQLMPATWTLYMDRFPSGREPIELDHPPLKSITSITYTDTNGDEQTLDVDSDIQIDDSLPKARIYPAYQETWPSTRNISNAVTIVFEAGYDDRASLPPAATQLMLLLVSYYFADREGSAPMPQAVDRLLSKLRILEFV